MKNHKERLLILAISTSEIDWWSIYESYENIYKMLSSARTTKYVSMMVLRGETVLEMADKVKKCTCENSLGASDVLKTILGASYN